VVVFGVGIPGVSFSSFKAYANDGHVNLAWDLSDVWGLVDHVNILRREKDVDTGEAIGQFQTIMSGWPPVFPYTDLVENGKKFDYQIQAIGYSGGILETSPIETVETSNATEYALSVQAAFDVLNASAAGSTVAGRIALYDVPMGFGSGVSGAMAWYSPYFNTITLGIESFFDGTEVQAALLAHEGTHAWWDFDATQGQPLRWGDPDESDRIGSNSIDQEYNAFMNGAAVWNEVKGSLTDYNQDGWAGVMALGEAEAKQFIRIAYDEQGLAEY